jgi:hypothetical protein
MRRAARAGDLLNVLLSGWGLDERLSQYRAMLIWDEVVGPQIAAHTRPLRIRDGILEVGVDQPTWMQQLQLLKPQILSKLNARLGDTGGLREIFLKRGSIAPRPAAAARTQAPRWRGVVLPAEEISELKALLAAVTDAELRQELENLLVQQARLTRAKKLN